jgi:hypothetical protein
MNIFIKGYSSKNSLQKEAENRLEKQHKDSIEFEIRKFRRRKFVQYHTLEKDQLQEVFHKLFH